MKCLKKGNEIDRPCSPECELFVECAMKCVDELKIEKPRFTFIANNQVWEIKEVPEDCGKLVVGGEFRQGSTHFDTQTLYVLDRLKLERKKEVLLHELGHCYLYATQCYYQKDSFTEEEVCEIIALYAEQMVKVMNEYFENKERGAK